MPPAAGLLSASRQLGWSRLAGLSRLLVGSCEGDCGTVGVAFARRSRAPRDESNAGGKDTARGGSGVAGRAPAVQSADVRGGGMGQGTLGGAHWPSIVIPAPPRGVMFW
jgi:hypothetical protein